MQLEVFEVDISPDLQQQLASVVQELGVSVPPAVSAPNAGPPHPRHGSNCHVVTVSACRSLHLRVSGSGEDGDL